MQPSTIKETTKYFESIVNVATLLGIFLFLLSHFRPDLLLSNTTTTGGDTASFNYMAKYMRDYLLPRGQIVGWSPDWFAGIPIFQFYFPLPFVMIAAIGYLVPLNIAFKLVTVLGTFLLPVTSFFSMRTLGFRFPVPIIASVFSLSFLFNESYLVWGGNIPSTMAGEFSYSLSLALMVLFLGTIYKGAETRRFWIVNSVLYAAIVLTHGYTTVFALLLSGFTLISTDRMEFWRRLRYLAKVYLLTFLLVSFWLLPFFLKREFSTPIAYVWVIGGIEEAIPRTLWPFYAVAVFGVVASVKNRDPRIWYFSFGVAISIFLWALAPHVGVTDIRFLPFGILLPVFVAAYGADRLLEDKRRIWLYARRFAPLILLIGSVFWVNTRLNFAQGWIEWNYTGFESKPDYATFSNITHYLSTLPYGRVVHEYSNLHDRFGTPRAFESIPFFTGKPVMEGLLIESALSSPYIFHIQSEISQTPTCPIPGQRCLPFSTANAARHLKLFNIEYLLATSPLLKSGAEKEPDFAVLKEFSSRSPALGIEVFKVNSSGQFVTVPNFRPILFQTKNWKAVASEWFSRPELLDVPLVFTNDLRTENSSRFAGMIVGENISNLPKIALDTGCSVSESLSNQEIKISTNCIDRPLLIKMSYFPNWHVEGADKIYPAAPSFMLIFPNQENVRLYYGDTPIDSIGKFLSALGVFFISGLLAYRRISVRT